MLALAAVPVLASRLTFNLTPSVPMGLYLTLHRSPARGDVVLIEPSPQIRAFAAARGYVSARQFLLKIIAAATGDRVCRLGSAVWINGHIRAWARSIDRVGRALPTWHGCRALRLGEVFVLGSHQASFDSRYFGPVRTPNVVAVAYPIWIFPRY